ncbi:response regulator [Chlorogloea sp. CCALA 695]|uniref:response regulator n=1 Tax=Chlorogloea sp. CCALA 695 TaxID=2107693 RepID=UPI000D05FD4F|nr:response regulator [Chlorogloea sp. CCALA 695]PSB31993.1 hybrid sensor histidine kinase/response regulator [Chlorogloea sp. CCALA 695]
MTTNRTINDETRDLFLIEAPELLENIERDLYSLGEDRSNAKVHNLMRMTHTLKGSAACVGLETIKTVAHYLEDVFKTLYNPEVVIDSELEALLFQIYECLHIPLTAELTANTIDEAAILNRAADVFALLQVKLGDFFNNEALMPTSAELGFDITESIFTTGVSKRLKELTTALENPEVESIALLLQEQATVFMGLAESLGLPGFGAIASATLTALNTHPDEAVTIARLALADFEQGQEAVIKGDRTEGGEPSFALQEWAISNQSLELDMPDPALLEQLISGEIEDELFTSNVDNWDFGEESLELSMDGVFGNLVDQETPIEDFELKPERSKEPLVAPSAQIRVEIAKLQRLNYLSGEMLTNQNRQVAADERIQETINSLQQQLAQHQKNLKQIREYWSDLMLEPQTNANNALSADIYHEFQPLLDLAWDDSVQIAESIEEVDLFSASSIQILEKQQRLLTNVRDDLLSAQMLPVGEIFNRFYRVLQQLVAGHGKQAQLEISGTEILVDKAIAEKLYDPLLHLVRNAFDHGLESSETRAQAGKPEVGEIFIKAYKQERWTVIAVGDDGKGLDFEKIGDRALELDLIAPEQAQSITEDKLIDLLFTPGFTTASQLSDLSGRGIGLDVVRTQIEALQGTITVRSHSGQGTTFLLQIPISLKIAKVLVVEVGDRLCGFISEAVEQIIIPQTDQIKHWHDGQKVWQPPGNGAIVPIRKLSTILQSIDSFAGDSLPVLLVRQGTELVGLEVDRVIGEQELVIKPVGKLITPPSYVLGCCVLADGRLSLIIDSSALIAQLPPVVISTQSTPTNNQSQILLIDDSVTVRHNLALMLQKVGYQVWQAKDGTEAVAQVLLHPTINLIISDVEMPGMNGFKFLSHRLQDSVLQQIPVIMLTSRSSDKYRQIAQELGANAYLTKPYIDGEVLNAIASLIENNPKPAI